MIKICALEEHNEGDFDDGSDASIRLIDIEDYEENIQIGQNEIRVAQEALDRSFETYIVLENLYEKIKTCGPISPQSKSFIGFAAEMAVTGTSMSSNVFVHDNITLEEIMQKKAGWLTQLYHNVKQLYQKNLDSTHYMHTMFNMQRSRLNKVKRQLGALKDSDKVTISTSTTKYMRCGKDNQPVRDFKEYLQEFEKLSDTMKPFLAAVKELADDDLFTTFSMIKNAAMFSAEDYFADRFDSLSKTLLKAKSSGRLKPQVTMKQYTTFGSDVMLGGGQVVVTTPNKGIYSTDDMPSMVDALKHFYMYMYRIDKFRVSSLVSGSTTMDISVKEAKQLIKAAEEIFEVTDGMLSLTTRLSTALTNWTNGPFYIMLFREKNDDYDSGGFFRSTRVLNRISAVLYDCVGSSYNYSIGNVKKSLSICEAVIKKA